jgi:hypothetical protein
LYRSLSFLDNAAGYDDFVAALEKSTESLLAEGAADVNYSTIDAVRETAAARGFFDTDCICRIVPFEDKNTRFAIGYGRERTRKMDYPFGLQWKIQFPKEATSAAMYFTWLFPEADDEGEPISPGYRVHVRRGAPVEVIWIDKEEQVEGTPAFTVVADASFDNSPTMVGFPFGDLPPAKEGEEIYVLLSAQSEEPVIIIKAELRLRDENAALPPEDSSSDSASVSPSSAATGGVSCQMSPGRKIDNFISLLRSVLI